LPLIDLRTEDGLTLEVFVTHKNMPVIGGTITLADGSTATRIPSVPARMSTQWADAAGTASAYFQESLGTMVTSEAHADRIAEERGLVRMDDYGKHAGQDLLEKHTAREAERNARIDAYEKQLAQENT
jgi:hypothetical protein